MGTDWKKLKAEQDAGIEPECVEEFESTDEQLATASAVYGGTGKQIVNIRLDSEIVSYFKSLGPGYQTKINDVLLRFVRAQKSKFIAASNSAPSSYEASQSSAPCETPRVGEQDLYALVPMVRQIVLSELIQLGFLPPQPASGQEATKNPLTKEQSRLLSELLSHFRENSKQ